MRSALHRASAVRALIARVLLSQTLRGRVLVLLVVPSVALAACSESAVAPDREDGERATRPTGGEAAGGGSDTPDFGGGTTAVPANPVPMPPGSGSSPTQPAEPPLIVDAGADGDSDAEAGSSGGGATTGTTSGSTSGDGGDQDAAPAEAGSATPIEPTTEPCATPERHESRVCGRCGRQERLCVTTRSGNFWLPWGLCLGETGACYPGEVRNQSCGRCGTKAIRCSATCAWQEEPCVDATGAECDAGQVEWREGLSCTSSGEGRYRVCAEYTCKWGAYSTECVGYRHRNRIELPFTADPTGGANWKFGEFPLTEAEKVAPMAKTATCPLAAAPTGTARATSYVELVNRSQTDALRVSLWQAGSPSLPDADLIVAVYADRARPPTAASERAACSYGVRDACADLCSGGFAGMTGADAIVVEPATSVLVYSARVTGTAQDAHRYQLHVRTDEVIPRASPVGPMPIGLTPVGLAR